MLPTHADGHHPAVTPTGDRHIDIPLGLEFFSLLEAVDVEGIAEDFDIGLHSTTHDFAQHLRVGILEGIDPSDSLQTLSQKTHTHDGVEFMAASTFSELTNARDYRAVVQTYFELLHTPQLYRQRAYERKRLEWLQADVIAVDATHLTMEGPVSITDEDKPADEDRTIGPEDGGIKLNLAAKVDGQGKHPLSAVLTPPDTHETNHFEHLRGDVALLEGTEHDTRIWTFDMGYTDYDRFCDLADAENEEFVTVLKSSASTTVVEPIQAVELDVHEEDGCRRITDEIVELGETGERFRQVTLENPDGEVTRYLTTLSPEAYDPVDVVCIYTLRWLIEIFFRETKQYMNIEHVHSTTLTGVVFEVFCTLIAYLLAEWFRYRHPARGGVRDALRDIRIDWNRPLTEYG